ncbi:hypothetical protein AAG906_003724 [Vitis piasezkii]
MKSKTFRDTTHVMPCTICQSCDHVVDECPTIPAMREMLGDQANLEKPSKFFLKPRPPPYQPQAQTQEPQQTSSMEQAIANLSKVMDDFVGEQKAINSQLHQKIENKIDNIQYSISRLTNLNTVNEKGKFPSQPSQNPKGVHEVETQEGESSKLREVRQDEELLSKRTLVKESNNQEEKSGKNASKSSIEEEPKIVIKEDMMKNICLPLFLKLYMERRKSRIHQKFLKGLHVTKNAFLTEQVSAIIQSKSPVKYKDPGCPTISVNIGGTHVEKALLDLGASVNLLPYSVYKQLGLGGLKPTTITLSLADRSVKIPRGVIEDVLVQVDKFYYPVDFVVLDTDPTIKEANCVPIILGRPFLATSMPSSIVGMG